MIRLIPIAVFVTASFFTQQALACSPQRAEPIDKEKLKPILNKIEQKFGLKSQELISRCGGVKIGFNYKPEEKIVPDDSAYASWNQSFILGDVDGSNESELIAKLNRIYRLSPDRMKDLKKSKTAEAQDAAELDREFGVKAYDPNALPDNLRFVGKKKKKSIAMPKCLDEGNGLKSESLGEVEVPLAGLEDEKTLNGGQLYKRGDLKKALKKNKAVAGNIVAVAEGNFKYRAKPLCAKPIGVERPINWAQAAKEFKDEAKRAKAGGGGGAAMDLPEGVADTAE